MGGAIDLVCHVATVYVWLACDAVAFIWGKGWGRSDYSPIGSSNLSVEGEGWQSCLDWDNAELYSLGEIEIGDDVVISQKSYLCAATHDYTKPSFDMIDKKITIEDQAWLATDVFIAPGVTIGRGSLIGARSSVFSDMPEGMVCIGSPAKPVKPRV